VNVEFRKSFEKDLGKIRDEDLLSRIKIAIEEVEAAESLLDLNNVKKLKADGDYYRIRIGDYRIGFSNDEDTITFVRILHRKEMYRYFP
jgi:mRNA interferase RelE/StbE